MQEWSVRVSALQGELLDLVVSGNFSCVDQRVAHDVRTETQPKSSDAIFSDGFAVNIENALVDLFLLG